MAQVYEADASPSQVRSYGWSAEEVARHERPERNSSRPGAAQEVAHHERPERNSSRPGPAQDASRDSGAPDGPRPQAPQTPDQGDPEAQGMDFAHPAYQRDEAGYAERRARMVRGRRRSLWVLIVLTVIGVALTFLRLASWWIVIPPVVLLAGYLLLLREAAHADAEARERLEAARERAGAKRERAGAKAAGPAHRTRSAHPARPAHAASPAHPARPAQPVRATVAATHETGPRADIIDLSEHVGDQLYDQYADAKLRAVGD